VLLRSLLSTKVRSLLIKGEPGTGKTTFAIELLREFGRGVYVSSRVSQEVLAEQNPQLEELISKGLVTTVSTDADQLRPDFSFKDYRLASVEDVFLTILGQPRSQRPDLLVVLDSWDSLAGSLDQSERIKAEQSLLVMAEANKVKLIFVSEEDVLTAADYFVDAVVKLEDAAVDGMRVRRLVWKKLRGAMIAHRSSLYTLAGGRMTIFDPTPTVLMPGEYETKPFAPIPHSLTRFSSGSRDLDSFLDGGFKRGTTVILELDDRIGPFWHVPLPQSIEMNFLSNGCGVFILPSGSRPAYVIKNNLLPYFPEEVLRKSLRIAQYDLGGSTDPCFVHLEKNSLEKTVESVISAMEEMKGTDNRPCFYFIGMDTVEAVNGREVADPMGIKLRENMRRSGDLTLLAMRTGSEELTRDLNKSCDLHLRLEEMDRTLVMHSIKPPSELFHVEYNHASGYPSIHLLPIV
jgi:KaiC/GvpD/RAD55 family RecA-like ATPase